MNQDFMCLVGSKFDFINSEITTDIAEMNYMVKLLEIV